MLIQITELVYIRLNFQQLLLLANSTYLEKAG